MLKVNNEGTTSRPVILIPLPLSAFLIFSLLKKNCFRYLNMIPVNICLTLMDLILGHGNWHFKGTYGNTRKICEICSKLTIKTAELDGIYY